MHGRIKRSSNYRAMALCVLGCSYLAIAPISAIAQGAGGKGVSVTVNPTTGYTVINSQTIGTPRGTTVGPSGGVPSVTTRPGGGLSQSLPAGIEITGIRQNAQTLRGPLGVNINAGLNSLRNGAIRCVTSMRCTTALGLGSMGLQMLLDEIDGTLNEEGRLEIRGQNDPDATLPPYDGHVITVSGSRAQSGAGAQCHNNRTNRGEIVVERYGVDGCRSCGENWNQPYNLVGYDSSNRNCLYGDGTSLDPNWARGPSTIPPASDVPPYFDNYTPQPSDWNWLTGGMNFSDPDVTIDITDLPTLDGSNEPNFIQNSDGTSRGTFNIYTPTARYNGSQKPEIEVRDQQTETNYDEQGNPTGSSTSTGTMTPNPGGSASSPDIVIPTDCDFMPTVCRFIDWFTEPDTQPDPDQEIRDLVQVYEDGGREVTVGPDSGSCPAPRIIELSLVPSVEFSFQPFCDLATAVRFWLLAIASFGAAYMTVRSI